MERSAVIQEIAKPNKELVDGFQSLTAATVIVPNGTGSERQPEFQFESTVWVNIQKLTSSYIRIYYIFDVRICNCTLPICSFYQL